MTFVVTAHKQSFVSRKILPHRSQASSPREEATFRGGRKRNSGVLKKEYGRRMKIAKSTESRTRCGREIRLPVRYRSKSPSSKKIFRLSYENTVLSNPSPDNRDLQIIKWNKKCPRKKGDTVSHPMILSCGAQSSVFCETTARQRGKRKKNAFQLKDKTSKMVVEDNIIENRSKYGRLLRPPVMYMLPCPSPSKMSRLSVPQEHKCDKVKLIPGSFGSASSVRSNEDKKISVLRELECDKRKRILRSFRSASSTESKLDKKVSILRELKYDKRERMSRSFQSVSCTKTNKDKNVSVPRELKCDERKRILRSFRSASSTKSNKDKKVSVPRELKYDKRKLISRSFRCASSTRSRKVKNVTTTNKTPREKVIVANENSCVPHKAVLRAVRPTIHVKNVLTVPHQPAIPTPEGQGSHKTDVLSIAVTDSREIANDHTVQNRGSKTIGNKKGVVIRSPGETSEKKIEMSFAANAQKYTLCHISNVHQSRKRTHIQTDCNETPLLFDEVNIIPDGLTSKAPRMNVSVTKESDTSETLVLIEEVGGDESLIVDCGFKLSPVDVDSDSGGEFTASYSSFSYSQSSEQRKETKEKPELNDESDEEVVHDASVSLDYVEGKSISELHKPTEKHGLQKERIQYTEGKHLKLEDTATLVSGSMSVDENVIVARDKTSQEHVQKESQETQNSCLKSEQSCKIMQESETMPRRDGKTVDCKTSSENFTEKISQYKNVKYEEAETVRLHNDSVSVSREEGMAAQNDMSPENHDLQNNIQHSDVEYKKPDGSDTAWLASGSMSENSIAECNTSTEIHDQEKDALQDNFINSLRVTFGNDRMSLAAEHGVTVECYTSPENHDQRKGICCMSVEEYLIAKGQKVPDKHDVQKKKKKGIQDSKVKSPICKESDTSPLESGSVSVVAKMEIIDRCSSSPEKRDLQTEDMRGTKEKCAMSELDAIRLDSNTMSTDMEEKKNAEWDSDVNISDVMISEKELKVLDDTVSSGAISSDTKERMIHECVLALEGYSEQEEGSIEEIKESFSMSTDDKIPVAVEYNRLCEQYVHQETDNSNIVYLSSEESNIVDSNARDETPISLEYNRICEQYVYPDRADQQSNSIYLSSEGSDSNVMENNVRIELPVSIEYNNICDQYVHREAVENSNVIYFSSDGPNYSHISNDISVEVEHKTAEYYNIDSSSCCTFKVEGIKQEERVEETNEEFESDNIDYGDSSSCRSDIYSVKSEQYDDEEDEIEETKSAASDNELDRTSDEDTSSRSSCASCEEPEPPGHETTQRTDMLQERDGNTSDAGSSSSSTSSSSEASEDEGGTIQRLRSDVKSQMSDGDLEMYRDVSSPCRSYMSSRESENEEGMQNPKKSVLSEESDRDTSEEDSCLESGEESSTCSEEPEQPPCEDTDEDSEGDEELKDIALDKLSDNSEEKHVIIKAEKQDSPVEDDDCQEFVDRCPGKVKVVLVKEDIADTQNKLVKDTVLNEDTLYLAEIKSELVKEDPYDPNYDEDIKPCVSIDLEKGVVDTSVCKQELEGPESGQYNLRDENGLKEVVDWYFDENKTVQLVEEQVQTPENSSHIAKETVPVFKQSNMERNLCSLYVLMQESIKRSCDKCVYCNHAKGISVNGKQLMSHLQDEHEFNPLLCDGSTMCEDFQSLKAELLNVYVNTPTYGSIDNFIKPCKIEYQCFRCNESFNTHTELCFHNRKFHQKYILCIMCKSNFHTYSELLCHLCPGLYVPESNNVPYRCCFCALDRLSAFRLMVHMRKAHHTCDICLHVTTDQQELLSHITIHKPNHLCHHCGIAYRNKSDMKKHMFWKHGTESVLCKKCLQKRWPHQYHFCVPPDIFYCEKCEASFTKAVALRVHTRLHDLDFPYSCKECQDRFISKKLLVKHLDIHRQSTGNDDVSVNKEKYTCKQESEQVVSPESDVVDSIIVDAATNETNASNTSGEKILANVSDTRNEDCVTKILSVEVKSTSEEKGTNRFDISDIPPLNLSSDSEDSEDEETSHPSKYDKTMISGNEYHSEKNSGSIEVVVDNDIIKGEEIALDVGIWSKFETCSASLVKPENLDEESSGVTPQNSSLSEKMLHSFIMAEHDYCGRITETSDSSINVEKEVYQEEDDAGNETKMGEETNNFNTLNVGCSYASSRVDMEPIRYSPVTAISSEEVKRKKENGSDTMHRLSSSSSSVSRASDTETSSTCSCSSCDSDSSDSDSSSCEDNRRRKREETGQQNSTNTLPRGGGEERTANTSSQEQGHEDNDDYKSRIRESDLDTEESDTEGEDFYEEYPEEQANKLYTEKRNELLFKTTPTPTYNTTQRIQSPVSEMMEPRKVRSPRKRVHPQRVDIPSDTSGLSLDSPPRNNSGAETGSRRYSKRRRVCKKFSDEWCEGDDIKQRSSCTADQVLPVSSSKLTKEVSESPANSNWMHVARRFLSRKRGNVSASKMEGGPANKKCRKEPPGCSNKPDKSLLKTDSTSAPCLVEDKISNNENGVKHPLSYTSLSDANEGQVDHATSIAMKETNLKDSGAEPKTERLYCYCQRPYDTDARMIGCDGRRCKLEWFHFDCVNIFIAPKGKWFCPDCSGSKYKIRRRSEVKKR